ncbi:MAG: 2-dehydro-3-deoxyglucarate aldolase [Bryobacterales bacterium]|nr:2-dehydro-3-deoxyglucarate aldolase [Bryobacterales bacterium]
MSGSWGALRAGSPVFGCFISTGYPVNAELCARAGFDYVLIDLEHGMGSERDVLTQVLAVSALPCAPVVRVESHDRPRVHRLLDLGVQGIMFPRVNTADEARACVAAMRYQPEGERGVATLVRASDYGVNFATYRDTAKKNLLTILQIESAEAVANVDEIAAVDGADVLYVGPMDLTTSMGIFRQYGHPDFVAALKRTVDAANRNGRIAGILLAAPADARRYLDLGFKFLTSGTDTAFLLNAARSVNESMRQA